MEFSIRPARKDDAKGVNQLRRMPGVFENTLGIPSERVEMSETFFSSLDRNQHLFVAETQTDEGLIIIGVASLSVESHPRTRHKGSVGIMVHREYQRQGVGRALMNALLDIADNWLMLKRVELTVYADNTKAIALYESLGFEKEGIKRMSSIRNGRYEDEVEMGRIRL